MQWKPVARGEPVVSYWKDAEDRQCRQREPLGRARGPR